MKKPMFSQRTFLPVSSSPLYARLEALRAEGASILDLTTTNPTRCGLDRENLVDKALKTLVHPLGRVYQPDPQGLESARLALSHWLSTRFSTVYPQDMHLIASSSEGYSLLFRLLCDPGDSILVPAPSYPLLDHIAHFDAVDLNPYLLVREGDSWVLDRNSVLDALDSRTRAVVVIQPGNPTGHVLSPADRQWLSDFCHRNGLALISDEVFSSFYPQDPHIFPWLSTSLVGWEGCLTFSMGGLSKSLGLPQFKLGWIATSGPEEDKQAALERLDLLNDAFLGASTPVQAALPALLELEEELCSPLRDRLRANQALLEDLLARQSTYRLCKAQGSWCVLLERPGISDDLEAALEILERHHVFVQPGFLFDFPGDETLVLSLLTPSGILREGLHRMCGLQ